MTSPSPELVIDLKALAVLSAATTIALAWNEAANKTVRQLYPQNQSGATIIYAMMITLIVLVIYAAFVHAAHATRKATKHVARLVSGNKMSPHASPPQTSHLKYTVK